MNKEQTQALLEAWELKGKILQDIRKLALMNVTLAYGVVDTGKTLIDVIMVDDMAKAGRAVKQARKQKGGSDDAPV